MLEYRKLKDGDLQLEYIWYADVMFSGERKDITFTVWNPVDWKTYEVYYNDSSNTISFSNLALVEGYNTIKVLKLFIDFIESDTYLNLVEIDDGEFHEYIFELK